MEYLVRRTYKYTTEEWVKASSEREAKSIPATENEDRIHDDYWDDSEIVDERQEDSGNE
jgi:hypothetical protein